MKVPVCETCGAAISVTAPEGLCGACLFQGFGMDCLGGGISGQGEVLRFFGDYELLDEVARGGMGVVYRARQVSLNRTVAVKLLNISGDGSKSFASRFKVEAAAAAGLDHPNIVPVFEFGEYGGQPFLAMRYVTDGRSLSGAKFSPREAVEIMTKTAQAMHYAHQRGVLHRDLKPANILLDEAGEPLVSDFGLAKLMESDSHLTRSVEMMGTPAYMPPEQASGKLSQVTTAADVYGLGAIFYELLTGRAPFTGGSGLEIIRKVTDEPPARLTSIVKTVDRDLQTICLKCLEKDPPKRYASALAMAEDLQRWLRHEPIRARPAGTAERLWKWARRHPAIASVSAISLLAVTVIAIGSTVFSLRLQKSAQENRRQIMKLHQLSAEQMVQDGEAFTGLLHLAAAIKLEERDAPGSAGVLRSYFQSIVRQNPTLERLWFHPVALHCATLSADGQLAAAGGADGLVRLYETATGALRHTFPHGSEVSRVLFNAGGSRLISYSESMSACLWDVETGLRQGSLTGGCHGAAFHPDGTRILVLTVRNAVECDAATGAVRRGFADLPATGGAWQADGSRLALGLRDAKGKYIIRLLDGESGVVLGESGPEDFPLKELTFSPDGALLIARSEVPTGLRGLRRVLVWKTAALHEPRLTFRDGVHRAATATFDSASSRVLVAGDSGNATLLDPLTLETRNAQFLDTGTLKTELTLPLGHQATLARFNRDDRRLLTATFAGSARIWDMQHLEVAPASLWHSSAVTSAEFSPAGDQILTASTDGTLRLFRLPPDGGAAAAIAHHEGTKRSDIVSLGPAGPAAMFSFSRAGVLRRWNPVDGRILSAHQHSTSHPDPVFIPGAGQLLLADKTRITAVSVATGEVLAKVETGGQLKTIHYAAGDNAGTRIAVCGPPQQGRTERPLLLPDPLPGPEEGEAIAVVYDQATGQPVGPPMAHPSGIRAVVFSPGGQQVLTGCTDGKARIWDAATGALVRELPHDFSVVALSWSPNGRHLLTGTGSPKNARQSAQLWDAGSSSGSPVWRVWHERDIIRMAFSPDESHVVVISADGGVSLLNTATGNHVTAMLRLQTRPDSIDFSPDSRCLAIAGNGLQPCLIDTRTGSQLAAAMLHPMPVRTVAFSADNRTLATGSNDSFLRLWPLEGATGDAAALQHTAELLSNHTLEGNGIRRLTTEEMQQRWSR